MDQKEALQLLKKYAPNKKSYLAVYGHSKAVAKYALWLARRIGGINREFIVTASLLHDIGRFIYPPGANSIKHGIAGANILREEGLPEKYARVCETHLGAGVTSRDIRRQRLDIPEKDFTPKTKEEKIISYADIRISGDKLIPIERVVRRFERKINKAYGKRVLRLHNNIRKLYKSDK